MKKNFLLICTCILISSSSISQAELTLSPDGKMGIGTEVPQYPVHVISNAAGNVSMTIRELSSTGYPGIQFEDSAGNWGTFMGFSNIDNHFRFHARDGAYLSFMQNFNERMRVHTNGNIGIKKTDPQYALDVGGTVQAQAFRTSPGTVADYVFSDNYTLMPIRDLADYVRLYRHLPNVPSQEEVNRDGYIDLAASSKRNLEKIEELVLYIIDINSRLEKLASENRDLSAKLELMDGRAVISNNLEYIK